MIVQHENKAHAATCSASELTRQTEVSQAISAGGGSATVAAAVRTAEIKFYRALIASAVANGLPSTQFADALRALGAGGS